MSETTGNTVAESAPALMPPDLMQMVLRPPPHTLNGAVAELIFLPNGQLVFCSRGKGGHSAKFVDPEDVKRAFNTVFTDSGWLPPNLVRWGHSNGKEWFVLFKSAQQYKLTLAGTQQESLNVPLPSAVILLSNHSLYVWAVKTPVFQPGALAFCMPLPNVAQSGLVCFGANQHPVASLQTANHIWETWISGAFTGESCTKKSRLYSDDVRQQLRALQGRAQYPKRDLVALPAYLHKTIAALVEHHKGDS